MPVPHLNGNHTIFGQCDDAAVEVTKAIARVPTFGDAPQEPVRIEAIDIRAAVRDPGYVEAGHGGPRCSRGSPRRSSNPGC